MDASGEVLIGENIIRHLEIGAKKLAFSNPKINQKKKKIWRGGPGKGC